MSAPTRNPATLQASAVSAPRRGARAALALACVPLLVVLGAGAAGAQVIREDLPITNGTVDAVAVYGNTLYLGGSFSAVGPTTGTGVPIDANTGAAIAGFPRVNGQVNAVISDGTGGWFIGGAFTSVGGLPRANLAHVLADNSVSPWDPGAFGQVLALALDGGTLYAGGSFSMVGGQSRSNLAAIDASTGAVMAWDPGVSSSVRALAVGSGVIYVGGSFTAIGATARMRLGAVDLLTGEATSWNPNSNSTVRALVVDGATVFTAGDFTIIGGQSRSRVAALDVASGLATTWNPGANAQVSALARSGSVLYAGGSFTSMGGQPRNRVAAIDVTTGTVTPWDPSANAQVVALAATGSVVYAGGDFLSIGGQARSRLAALDATTGLATSWSPEAYGAVFSIATYGSVVYAGGFFTGMGGVPRSNLAAIDLVTGQIDAWNPGTDSEVLTLAQDGNMLYAGGSFTSAAGQVRNSLAAFDLSTGQLTGWNPNVSGFVSVITTHDSLVYVGGSFAQIGGLARDNVAALAAATGVPTAWNPGTDGEVFSLLRDDGVVYVGGTFTTAGGALRNNVAALDATTGLATSWNPISNGTVRAIATSCGRIFVGGFFTTIGGQSRSRIALLDATTGLASPWDPNSNGPVYELEIDGRTVYVGGVLSAIGGLARNRLATLDLSTGLATPWDPDAGGTIRSLVLDSGNVYVGGNFASMDTTLQTNFAVMTGDATLACPPITLAPASLPALLVGAPFNQVLTPSGGTGPWCWKLTGGPLPPGLSFDDGTGTISGTPTTGGTYAFTITATAADGCAGSQAYVLQVDCPAIALAPASLPAGAVGAPYAQALTPGAGTAPFTWAVSSGSLPDGITLSSATGVLSGTPTTAGTAVFSVAVTDAYGCSGSANYTLDVFLTPPASIVAANTSTSCLSDQNPCVSIPFVYSRADSVPARGISVTFQIDTTLFVLCNAGPAALSIHPGPWLSGFTNTNFQVVDHGGGSYTVDQAIFGVPCGITTGGVLFTVDLASAGPDGTGQIAVTQVKSRDCDNQAIAAAPGPDAPLLVHHEPIAISPDTLPPAPVNAAYSQLLTVNVGTPPIVFAVTAGALPPGLSLASDGVLSGTPTTYGSYPFTVTATDAGSCYGTHDYTLEVTCPVVTVTPATLPNAPIGVAYAETLVATGGDSPVTFAVVTGTLPPGLSLAGDGAVTGTPTTTGTYPFTVRVSSTGGCALDLPYTIGVACPAMAVLPAWLSDAVAGTPYVQSVSASAGIGPIGWDLASGTLPDGLVLDPGTGEISGTPTTLGTSVFTLRATDAFGCTAQETYTLSVLASPPSSYVGAVTDSLCLSTAHTCVAVPFRFTRGETAPARGVSVTFSLEPGRLGLCTPSTPDSSVHLGSWLAGYTNAQMQVTDAGNGTYTVDLALFGPPCGPITGGELFTVDVASTGVDGTGAIEVIATTARDCDNAPIGVLPGPVASLEIHHAAPAAVADLATAQVLENNPPGQTTGITVTWTPVPGTTTRLYRAPFGAYPLYDANGPVAPPDPLAAPNAPWELAAATASPGYVDYPATRGWWQYVAFSEDSCGNLSAVSNLTPGSLDYHLGDVSDGVTVGTGNNLVSDEDVSLLGANYGIGEPDITNRGVDFLDIGPTSDYLPTSRPEPDHVIDFEDFILFAANYQVTSGPARPARRSGAAAAGALEEFSLSAPATVQAGQDVTATVRLNGSGRVQGFSAVLDWDAAVVQPVGVAATPWFQSQDGLVLSTGPGRVDAALLGARQTGLVGDVDVATVTFQALATGATGLRLGSVVARDAWNQPVETGIQVADATTGPPHATALAPPRPNPSRGSTTLEFSLARSGTVELAIYGVDGRRVKLLAQGACEAGEYRLSWDGTDDRGRAAAPGVYYARLGVDGRVFTRKLVRLDR